MDALLSVLTSPRANGTVYLDDTLAALEREGAADALPAERRIVCVDGMRELPKRWRDCWVHLPAWPTGERVGGTWAAWTVFRYAAALGVDRLLWFEDDVLPVRNCVRAALALPIPDDVAFVSLFDADNPGLEPGLRRVRFPGTMWRCSQAAVFPRRTLEVLARADPDHMVKAWATPNHIDSNVGCVCVEDGGYREYGLVVPNWIEHVGEVSACDPTRSGLRFRSRNWAGPDFDALTFTP